MIKELIEKLFALGLDPKHPMVKLTLEKIEEELDKASQVQLNLLLLLLEDSFEQGYNYGNEPFESGPTKREEKELVLDWSGLTPEDMINSYKEELFLGLKRELILGLSAGVAFTTVWRKLKKREQKYYKQLEVLVETESTHHFAEGTKQSYEDRGVSHVMWLATPSERTCAVCSKYDEEVWSLQDPKRPTIPAHPRCRCVWVAYFPEEGFPMDIHDRWKEKGFDYNGWLKYKAGLKGEL